MPKNEVDPQDPMELVGVALPNDDVDRMVECLIEEYLFMGWSERQLMDMFRQPFFRTPHGVYHDRGEEYVRARMESVRARYVVGIARGGETNG